MIEHPQTPTMELSEDQIDAIDDFVCDLKADPCRNYADRLLRMLDGFGNKGYDLSRYKQVYESAQELIK
jgi:hypothetical protein|tara:strand:- start:3492 stop:3698 length:207 start_codon:yes stop_codon:yes gene_type:complete